MDKVQRTGAEWRERLTPEGYRVLRQAGTEAAWTGEYTDSPAPAAGEASG
ncbi:MAG TPA: peptide-methionine (R)-S-oxide reductase [Streptosporangiaceae bacterium]|nr:peptide-methionine (R)-S-oxide reductase [Streptosporangiaceae bacterium]